MVEKRISGFDAPAVGRLHRLSAYPTGEGRVNRPAACAGEGIPAMNARSLPLPARCWGMFGQALASAVFNLICKDGNLGSLPPPPGDAEYRKADGLPSRDDVMYESKEAAKFPRASSIAPKRYQGRARGDQVGGDHGQFPCRNKCILTLHGVVLAIFESTLRQASRRVRAPDGYVPPPPFDAAEFPFGNCPLTMISVWLGT